MGIKRFCEISQNAVHPSIHITVEHESELVFRAKWHQTDSRLPHAGWSADRPHNKPPHTTTTTIISSIQGKMATRVLHGVVVGCGLRQTRNGTPMSRHSTVFIRLDVSFALWGRGESVKTRVGLEQHVGSVTSHLLAVSRSLFCTSPLRGALLACVLRRWYATPLVRYSLRLQIQTWVDPPKDWAIV